MKPKTNIMDRHILLLAATMAMATTTAAQSVLPDTTATLNVRVGYSKSSQNTLTGTLDKVLQVERSVLFDIIYSELIDVRHRLPTGHSANRGTSYARVTQSVANFVLAKLALNDEDTRFSDNYWAGYVFDLDMKPVPDREGNTLCYLPWEVQLDLSGSPYVETAGARMKKYEADATAYEAGKLQDNDIVLYRYADVLLMKAEALVRDGKDGSPYLNQVRSRADMPLCECTLENILRERLLELVWEGWRRNDLVRYGLFHRLPSIQSVVVDETDAHTIVFPIPATTLDLNKQLTQNKGYDI